MGLDINGVRFLLFAKKIGANFEHTAMLGRQYLDLSRYDFRQTMRAFGYTIDKSQADKIITGNNGFAETLINYLGATVIHSFDVSQYEGATHLHDMNKEIPGEFIEQYSVILDGGSLEHVFNFPTAIKNCMEMLKIGGYYLGITPANNFMGHGLYQFSPELYFSIFTPDNGFKLIDIIAFEDKPGTTWYSIKNPKDVNSRIQLINDHPVYLLIIAQKVKKTTIFEITPQQSDYVTAWNQKAGHTEVSGDSTTRTKLAIWAKRNLPYFLITLIKSILIGSGFNPRFFRPVEPTTYKNRKFPNTE